jgi:hypothetical protein
MPEPEEPTADAYQEGRERFAAALERLIMCAEFYVTREIEEGHDLSKCLSGLLVGALTRQAFIDADRARALLGYAKVKGRGYRPVPGQRDSDLAAALLHNDLMTIIGSRWGAREQWFEDVDVDEDEDGIKWRGLAYPDDFPEAAKYRVLSRELELLKGALRLLGMPVTGVPKTGARAVDSPPTETEVVAYLRTRRRPRHTLARFIEYMADKPRASFDELKEHAHQDETVDDNTVAKLASEAGRAMKALKSPIRYPTENSEVRKVRKLVVS